MTTLADLHRAVRSTLASKRLGRPVFVRYLLQTRDDRERVLPTLARLASEVHEWLGQPPHRLYATGTVESGQVVLTLEFREGATALVTWARTPGREVAADLLVLGNHGALYHEAAAGEHWDEEAAGKPDAAFLKTIEGALRSGTPELVGAGGKP